jgi:hypothetical protein
VLLFKGLLPHVFFVLFGAEEPAGAPRRTKPEVEGVGKDEKDSDADEGRGGEGVREIQEFV